MARGRVAEACARFEQSERRETGLGTEYHLADCYEALGKTASAHALFVQIAERARALGQKPREELARQRAQSVASKLVRLRIAVPHAKRDEVTIERDGKKVVASEWDLAVPVDPGVHRIRAFGAGLVPWETDVAVPAEPGIVTVSVPPLMSDGGASFWAPTTRKVGVAVLGVGLAGLGVGTAFALHARSRNEDSYDAGCSDEECPTARALNLRQAALTAGNRATWAIGVGASSVAAGTALFFWDWSEDAEDPERESMQIAPVAHARGGGLRVQGRF